MCAISAAWMPRIVQSSSSGLGRAGTRSNRVKRIASGEIGRSQVEETTVCGVEHVGDGSATLRRPFPSTMPVSIAVDCDRPHPHSTSQAGPSEILCDPLRRRIRPKRARAIVKVSDRWERVGGIRWRRSQQSGLRRKAHASRSTAE